MAKYNLKTLIDTNTVEQFNLLKQRIVIVKETEGSNTDVAWVAFSPFEINTVSWGVDYGVYASCSNLSGKATINRSSFTAASEKQSYAFSNGVFEPPVTDRSLADNTYEVKNNMTEMPMLTFGLAQDITANGVNYDGHPVNAVQVMSKESATFTPHEKIRIFMSSVVDNGMVISRIKSESLTVDFTDENEITIKYDPSIGGFVKA